MATSQAVEPSASPTIADASIVDRISASAPP
jgi:hypothetical protein